MKERPCETRQRLAEEGAAMLNLDEISKGAQALVAGNTLFVNIPVSLFYDPKGGDTKGSVMPTMIKTVELRINSCDKQFCVCGGTYGGIEMGVILIRRDR